MKKLLSIGVLLLLAHIGQAQQFFYAVASARWDASGTWSTEGQGGTPIVCAPCTAGVHYPGVNDIAFTEGFLIDMRGANKSVESLWVAYNVTDGIYRSAGAPISLTITGELVSYDPVTFDYALPTTTPIESDGSLTLIFTGTTNPSILNTWNTTATLRRVQITPPLASSIVSLDYPLAISGGGSFLTVNNGILQINDLLGGANGSTLTVGSGATVLVNSGGSIRGTSGTNTSRFGTIVVNGTLTSASSTSTYINSTTFTLNSGANLNVGLNGANQFEGWYYRSNPPTTLAIDAASTVTYNSATAQNIYATTYGNLSLSSSSAVTKTLVGTGLTIQGNLTVGANVTFSPASQVDFIGTTAQSISGTGTLNLNGGIEVNKASNTITFAKALSVTGITMTSGTLSFGDVTSTVSGLVSNPASTITSGNAGTVSTTGTTTFSGAGSTTLNNLTVSSGTTTFSDAFTINGNVVNSGALSISSTATVTFAGGSNQAISGNAFSVGNMVVNKTATTLNNNGNIELTGTLTMTTGTFDADGGGSGVFTLNSDTNGDAAIGPMAGGSITGNVTFERYFDNTANRWRNLAFPVTNVARTSLGASLTLNTNSLATYTESTLGNVDQGWVYVNSGTLNSTRGHSAWMYNIAPITISVRGPLLRSIPAESGSPYNFGVTYTNDPGQPATEDGWNFLPNPFASPINWNNAGWVKTNVNAAIAVWDVAANAYRYTGIDWDGTIAQGQAFWVQTNAASPVLTATESVKITNSNPAFYRVASPTDKLIISLRQGTNVDKAALQFNEEATVEFDGEFDAYKLKNAIYNLSTVARDGSSMAINVMPKTACTSAINLNITNTTPGSYQLSFEGLSSFQNLQSLYLTDHYTNEQLPVGSDFNYSFEITSDPATSGANRFTLNFGFSDLDVAPAIMLDEDKLLSSVEGDLQWYLDGEKLEGFTTRAITPIFPGQYTVATSKNGCTLTSESFTYSRNMVRAFPNPLSTNESLNVYVGDLTESFAGSGEIVLYSPLGIAVAKVAYSDGDRAVVVSTESLTPGSYLLSILTADGKIISRSKVIIR